MTCRIIIAFVCLVAAWPLFAAPVVVRSGEHGAYTRLVLSVPLEADWSIDEGDRTARIRLSGHSDGFNTQDIFRRIDQARISSVQSTPSELFLELGCACEISTILESSNLLVIDVSERADQGEVRQILDIASSDLAFLGQGRLSFDGKPRNVSSTVTNVSPTSAPGRLPDFAQLSRPNPIFRQDGPSTRVLDEEDQPNKEELAQLQQQLAQGIGRAATRGILTADPNRSAVRLPTGDGPIDLEMLIEQAARAELASAASNLRVHTSDDPGATEAVRQDLASTTGLLCPDPTLVDVLGWTDGKPASVQFAAGRNALYGEFDRIDDGAVEKLAKTYLYFGFGPEARQIIELDPDLAARAEIWLEMADILEFGSVRGGSKLNSLGHCDSAVALWAVLAADASRGASDVNANAALRTLNTLPAHLRTYLAPLLSRRLLESDMPDAASAAMRNVERLLEPVGPAGDLARAMLDLNDGKAEKATARLEDVVASNSQQSAEALVAFVETRLEEKRPVSEETATLIEAYALEHRDGALGPALKRANVLALGQSQQFSRAFDALDRIIARDGAENTKTLRSDVLNLLTETAGDVAFLEHSFAHLQLSPDALENRTRLMLARRLSDLGFSSFAQTILTASERPMRSQNARILQAEIALALGDVAEAETAIAQLDTSEAQMLRAKIKSAQGDHEDAHRLFEAVGEREASARQAVLADNWTTLTPPDLDVVGPLVSLVGAEMEDDPSIEGMLSRSALALEESASARGRIRDLISAPRLLDPSTE